MRVHAAQTPQASANAGFASAASGFELTACEFAGAALSPAARQFRSCATDSAVSRLPTPAGPAKSRLGGSVPSAADRESSLIWRKWPTTSRNGIQGLRDGSYHFN